MISVVVSTFNKSSLKICLKALDKQDSKDFEVIVVDDGGTPPKGVLKKRRSFDLKYVWQPDLGYRAARNRNNGIIASKGEAVLFLDADVVLNQGALGSYDAILTRYSGEVIGVGRHSELTKAETSEVNLDLSRISKFSGRPDSRYRVGLEQAFEIDEPFYHPTALDTGNVMYPRKVLDRIGMFDEDFEGYGWEDSELSYRAFKGKMGAYYHDAAWGVHLYHEVVSKNQKDLEKNLKLLFEKHPGAADDFHRYGIL